MEQHKTQPTMGRKWPRIAFPWLAALMLAAAFGPARALTLADAYAAALGYDSQYAAARNQLIAISEKLPQARAALLPNLSVTASTDWNRAGSRQPMLAHSAYNSNGYQIRLTQPLIRLQEYSALEQSKLQIVHAEAQFATAGHELILRVAQAYFDTLLAQDTLAYTRSQKEALQQQLQHMKKALDLGVASIVDFKETRARLDLVVAQELQGEGDLDVKRYALSQLIGADPGELAPANSNTAADLSQSERLDQWMDAAAHDNFGVVAANAAFEIAQRETTRSRQALLPTVDLVVSQNVSKGDVLLGGLYTRSETNTRLAGLQLSAPLFEGGGSLSKVRETDAQKDKARDDLDTAKRAAQLSARQAYVGVTSGAAQVKALEVALDSNLSALEASRRGFQLGTRNSVDVLNAEQQTYSTRRDLAKARYDMLVSQLKLKAAAGRLRVEDVAGLAQ